MASLNSSVVHGSLAVTNEIHGKLDGSIVGSAVTNLNSAIPALLNKDTYVVTEYFVAGSSATNRPADGYNWHIQSMLYKLDSTAYRVTQIATASGSGGGSLMYERSGYSSDGSAWTFTGWKSTINTDGDTKVKITAKTDNVAYPLLAAASASPTSGSASEAVYDTGVTLNPSTNTIAANISGNSATATKASSSDKAVALVDYGDTSKTIKVGYSSAALTSATYLAAYGEVNGQRVIKDIKVADVTVGKASKVSNALTIGSVTYDGSEAKEITAADLGAITTVAPLKLNTSDMPAGSANLADTTTKHTIAVYQNGLSIPYQGENSNDGGILRVKGSDENSTILELGTWDDSGAGETIQFNYYPTTSQVTPTYSVSVPKKTGTIALTSDIPTASNITGILPINHGGTGAESAKTAIQNLISEGLEDGSSDITDGTHLLTSIASDNGFDTGGYTNIVFKRPGSAVWGYIKNKINSELGLTTSEYKKISWASYCGYAGTNYIGNSYLDVRAYVELGYATFENCTGTTDLAFNGLLSYHKVSTKPMLAIVSASIRINSGSASTTSASITPIDSGWSQDILDLYISFNSISSGKTRMTFYGSRKESTSGYIMYRLMPFYITQGTSGNRYQGWTPNSSDSVITSIPTSGVYKTIVASFITLATSRELGYMVAGKVDGMTTSGMSIDITDTVGTDSDTIYFLR